MNENERLEFYPSRVKYIGMLFLSLILVISSVFFIIAGFNINIGIDISTKEGTRSLVAIIGVICFVFFSVCDAYIIYRLVVRKPSVIIDKEGFTDNASAIGVGMIKWNEINNVFIYYYFGQKFLGIIPTNKEEIMNKIPKTKKALLRLNKGIGAAPINIPQSAINIKLEELIEHMRKYIEK